MSSELIRHSPPRRALADVAVIATAVGLVLSLAIAITTVSIGIARAEAAMAHTVENRGR